MFRKFLKTNTKKSEKGFTLIEMIVSIAIFSIVVVMALGALLVIIEANSKSKSVKLVVNNLNMALESMSRELRVGYDYNCASSFGGDCSSGGSTIYFKTKDGDDAYYKFSGNTLKRKIDEIDSAEVSLIGSDVFIEDLTFYVEGTGVGDEEQPRILVTLKGLSEEGTETTEFNIQTTISQRQIEP